MKPSNVFQLEVASALARPGVLFMRLGLPLLLGAPFALVAMPPEVRASGLAMLLLFVCLFGAAVGHARRQSEGVSERLALLPIPPALLWCDLLLAGVTVRLAQTALVVGLFIAIGGTAFSAVGIVSVVGLWCASVVVLTALGMGMARLVKSNAEVHLASALAVAGVAFISGLFPVPDRIAGFVDAAGWVNPISRFRESLVALSGGESVYCTGWMIAGAVACGAVIFAIICRSLNVPSAAPPSAPERGG